MSEKVWHGCNDSCIETCDDISNSMITPMYIVSCLPFIGWYIFKESVTPNHNPNQNCH